MTLLRKLTLSLVLLSCASLLQGQSCVENPALSFTTIDVPTAGATAVYGINAAGDIVGNYGKTNNQPYHSFSFRNGTFSYFDFPGAESSTASGINDSGLIVGYAKLNGVTLVGFTYDGTKFTSIRDSSNSATYTVAINNAGDMVGGAGTIYATKGFELLGKHFKAINFPGTYVYAFATGINNLGEIAGWTDNSGYAYRGGKFEKIAFPGAFSTEAWGVNDNGVIVGWYNVGKFTYGFELINGHYTSFGYPGAEGTFAYGINGAGEIVGEYTLDYKTYHGFVTSPIALSDCP